MQAHMMRGCRPHGWLVYDGHLSVATLWESVPHTATHPKPVNGGKARGQYSDDVLRRTCCVLTIIRSVRMIAAMLDLLGTLA